MKRMSKLWLVLAAMLLVLLLPMGAALAEEETTTVYVDLHGHHDGVECATSALYKDYISESVYNAATARIHQAALNYATKVDLSDLKIPYQSNDLGCPTCQVYFGAQEDRPDIFWLADSYSCNYYTSTGYVNYITLNYIDNKSRIPSMRTEYEAKIQSVLNTIPRQYTSALDKALYLHDWLILNNRYDPDPTGNYSQISHSGYGAMVEGTTVCSGYARAYRDMLTRLGIPCRYIRSQNLNHAWNQVQIDGQWYEVDVTWDDASVASYGPDEDKFNYVAHDHFLVTSSQMRILHSGGYDAYSYNPKPLNNCTSTKFDSYAFRYVKYSSMYKKGDLWYYLDSADRLVCSKLDGSSRRVIFEITGYPVMGYFANGRFYYSEGRALRSINLDGTGKTRYYTYPSGWGIHEFYVTNDRFIIGAVKDYSYQLQYHLLSDYKEGNPGWVEPEQYGPQAPAGGTGWVSDLGSWYYYRGYSMVKGWLKVGGTWYYTDPYTGAMKTGWQYVDGDYYYFRSSGAMATGWVQIGGSWYYLAPSGAAADGWVKSGGAWYYIQDGLMLSNTWKYDGGQYYFLRSSGAMATGWSQIGGDWYYFGSGGAMHRGWLYSGGSWYYMNKSTGIMIRNTRFIDPDTGRVYYFDRNGRMM